ncbi:uncharacterized protein LOC134270620 [Saccostrea cucullata]|uniref:uncharacterized protein LOC134270620 n=1 Tax=Saccostrea cuccullata TaxID=36930 RepID=UPI002ECFE903
MTLFPALLLFVGVAFCSAAPTDIEKRSTMVKRAQEVMMFGNRQNKPRIKKSDPDVPALPDLKGSVVANKAKDIVKTKTAELPKGIEEELEDVSDDVTTSKDTEEVQSESNEQNEPTTDELLEDFPPETVEALKELENIKNEKNSEEQDNTASEDKTDEEDKTPKDNSVPQMSGEEDMIEMLPEDWYNNPVLAYQLYRAYKKLPAYGYSYYRRRRRSPLKSRLLTNEMKRSHRAKRDLPYTEEEYPIAYYQSKFGPSYTLEDLESYAREKEYEDSVLRSILNSVTLEDVQEIEHQGVTGLFIPLEDEEPVMSTSKRSPYFYPYSQEPESHFGAFVPEKRDYLDSYSRLVQLARELSKSDSPNQGYQRW